MIRSPKKIGLLIIYSIGKQDLKLKKATSGGKTIDNRFQRSWCVGGHRKRRLRSSSNTDCEAICGPVIRTKKQGILQSREPCFLIRVKYLY